MRQPIELSLPPCEYAYGAEALAAVAGLGAATDTPENSVLGQKLSGIRSELELLAQPQTSDHQEERNSLLMHAQDLRRFIPKNIGDHREVIQDPATWLAETSDTELLAFLRWNEQSLRPLQADLNQKVADFHPRIMDDISWMAAQKYVPATLPDLMQKTIAEIPRPSISDIFDAALGQHNGYYNAEDHHIWLAEYLLNNADPDRLYKVLLHEYLHAASRHAVFNLSPASKASKEYGLIVPVWAYESNIEHLAQAAINNEFEIVVPEDRTQEIYASYEAERELFGLMLDQIPNYASIEDTSHACFTPPHAQGRFVLKGLFAKMDLALEQVLECPNSIQRVEADRNKSTSYRERRKVTEDWTRHVLRKGKGMCLLDEDPTDRAQVTLQVA